MLPFLKPKQMGSVIRVERKEDGTSESLGPEDEHDPGMVAAAEQFINAVHSKDAHSLIEAVQSMYDMMESKEPENEGM